MAAAPLASLVHHLRRLSAAAGGDDRELLDRFARTRDEATFAAIVRRHGPLVWGVCRRELRHEQDAEDAFQATFLVLARKAGAVRWRPSVAGWLFAAARRVASEAARKARRRDAHERRAPLPAEISAADAARHELQAVLNEELARLPEPYRSAVLLCLVEGRLRDEAARELGCSPRSVKHRLERGRELLRERLAWRGWGLPAALIFAGAASPAPPATLPAAAVRRALNPPPAPTAPAWGRKFAVLVVALAAACLPGAADDETPPVPAAPAQAKAEEPRPTPRDDSGDPLPGGALFRLGTTRFRHGNGVQYLALSPDGKLLATAGGDEGHSSVQILDAASGTVLTRLENVASDSAFAPGRRFLDFSADGKSFTCGGADGYARVFDAATGKQLVEIPPAREVVWGVALSPDGAELAVGGEKTVRVYDLKTLKERFRLPSGGPLVLFAPDGRCLVYLAPGEGDTLALVDPKTQKELRKIANGSKVVRAALSADGKMLAAIGTDRKARVWDADAGKELHAFDHPMPDKRGELTAVAFAPDGRTLATGASDNHIRLWDLKSGKPAHTLKGHGWWVTGLAFAPDGKTLYSASWDATVRRWDVAAGKEIPGPPGYVHHANVARSADGKRLATSGGGGGVHVWDGAGKLLRTLETREANALALSRDGGLLATGHSDGAVRLWDGAGKLLHTLAGPAKGGRHEAVALLAFSHDDGRLAAALNAGGVRVWDLGAKPVDRHLPHPDAGALAFSPDGRTLATGGWDQHIRFWDPATGKRHGEAVDAGAIVDSLAFSPDGRLLASSHHDRPIRLWDASSWSVVRELKGHAAPRPRPGGRESGVAVWSVTFTADGQWLVSTATDQTLRVWDVGRGQEVLLRAGHRGWVMRAALDPLGRTALTGSLDTTALMWSLRPEPGPAGADALWEALAGKDGAAAYRAVWALAEDPKAGVTLLTERLKPAKPIEPARLEKLLKDLNSKKFAEREAAVRELTKVAALIEPRLRQELRTAEGLEARRRLELVLGTVPVNDAPWRLRERAAVAALERMGGAEARKLLETLAGGWADAPLTHDARAALARLGPAR